MPHAEKKQTAHITNPRHPILIVGVTSSVTTRPPRTAQEEEDEEDFFFPHDTVTTCKQSSTEGRSLLFCDEETAFF